jgi:hypothetical protein
VVSNIRLAVNQPKAQGPDLKGVAFCGVLTLPQVSRLTTGTLGFRTRRCTWLTSRTVRPWKSVAL